MAREATDELTHPLTAASREAPEAVTNSGHVWNSCYGVFPALDLPCQQDAVHLCAALTTYKQRQ